MIKNLIIAMAVAAMAVCSFSADAKEKTKKQNIDIYDLSIDDNIAMPELEKQAETIKKFQYNQAIALQKNKQNVEMTRDGEVIIITIPAGQLFAPNDTVLSDMGKKSIEPFLGYLKNEGLYKMLLVMHHDNTGSDRYILNLTKARVNAIYDWISKNARMEYVMP